MSPTARLSAGESCTLRRMIILKPRLNQHSGSFSWRKKRVAFHERFSFFKIEAQAIFRDACGKRKREDPPGRKDGIAERFLRGKRRKKKPQATFKNNTEL
jgi:hypothetical protein